ncbi:unnamed protein product [Auanema sp. JU1783]|nr:unnamed protein product [Auanema sp. JU1783]
MGPPDLFSATVLSLALVGDITNCLLIYVIITRSSNEINLYRYSLLKLTICDLIFSLCGVFLTGPDILFPLPVAAINGLAQYFGEEGSRISVCILVISGMTVFTANNDCCFTRLMIIYQRQDLLDFTFSFRGFIMVIAINIVFAIIVTPPLYYAANQNEFVLETVQNKNLTHFLRQYEFDTTAVFVTVDIYSDKAIPLAIITVFGLGAFYVCNLAASIFTAWKVNNAREHLSESSYKLQRQLSIMLVIQNLYPIVAITIPLIVVMLVVTNWSGGNIPLFLFDIPYLTVTMYPLASGSLSFYFVGPYRKFLFEKFFCRDNNSIRSVSERTNSAHVQKPRL